MSSEPFLLESTKGGAENERHEERRPNGMAGQMVESIRMTFDQPRNEIEVRGVRDTDI